MNFMLNLPFHHSNDLAQDVHILRGPYEYQVPLSAGMAAYIYIPLKKYIFRENLALIVRTSPIGQDLEQLSR